MLKEQNARQSSDNSVGQRNLDRGNDDRVVLLRQRESEVTRGKELQACLFDNESKIRSREDNIMIVRKENDETKFSNAGLNDRNSGLHLEIDALQAHISVLEQ